MMLYIEARKKHKQNLLIMTYLIDLNLAGTNFKMSGSLDEIEKGVKKHGGSDLSIFDSRIDENKKIIQFMAGSHQVTGHAVKA